MHDIVNDYTVEQICYDKWKLHHKQRKYDFYIITKETIKLFDKELYSITFFRCDTVYKVTFEYNFEKYFKIVYAINGDTREYDDQTLKKYTLIVALVCKIFFK